MEEETDRGVWEAGAEERRNEHEVVVIHPDWKIIGERKQFEGYVRTH